MHQRGWKWALTAGTVILALSGCGTDPGNQGAGENASEGDPKAIYQNNCASCHGQNLEGNMGPSLQKIGSKLSDKEIANIIQNGQGRMPAQNQVSDADRAELAAWLSEKK